MSNDERIAEAISDLVEVLKSISRQLEAIERVLDDGLEDIARQVNEVQRRLERIEGRMG